MGGNPIQCLSKLMSLTLVYDNVNNNMFTSCVYVDYSRAFDSLDPDILLYKLKCYGLDSKSLKWCESYLRNRKIKTKVQNSISTPKDIKYGVPQGSCLGPLFFIIFVNDLFHFLDKKDEGLIMYADDTVLISNGISEIEAMNRSQKLYTQLLSWCDMFRLTVNVKKTKHMLFNFKRKSVTAPFSINGELENVCSYKYLGVDVDNLLSFNKFIENIRLYNFAKIRQFLTESIACQIFKQTILPLFEYYMQVLL